MDSFVWDTQFETGLDTVDMQHQGLVSLINQMVSDFAEKGRVPENLDRVFDQLASYAAKHFRDEEALMAQHRVDPRHVEHHKRLHRDFMAEVAALKTRIDSQDPKGLERLLSFLVHWLGYHILGADQNLARQIEAIEGGANPAEAFERDEHDRRKTTKPLVRALDHLFHILSERNKELLELNQTLEARVEERTLELRRANTKLETLSLTDMLTGLPNRRYAMQTLEALWAESTDSNAPFVVIMVDADHFKDVNDTYGHEAGDQVLRTVARELQHGFRTDDIVCRIGGDEFLVICPKTELEGGMRIAEQTRARIASMCVEAGKGEWVGSVSIGVAVRTSDMSEVNCLMTAADEGVYAAKSDGKNRVRTAQEPPTVEREGRSETLGL